MKARLVQQSSKNRPAHLSSFYLPLDDLMTSFYGTSSSELDPTKVQHLKLLLRWSSFYRTTARNHQNTKRGPGDDKSWIEMQGPNFLHCWSHQPRSVEGQKRHFRMEQCAFLSWVKTSGPSYSRYTLAYGIFSWTGESRREAVALLNNDNKQWVGPHVQ